MGTINKELWGVVELAGPSAGHTALVGRAGCYPRCGRPKEVGLEDPGLLPLIPASLLHQDYTAPPTPKCLTRNRFLSDDPTYQDVQQQLLLLTLAYSPALQYWVEKVNPPTIDNYCPLAMSVIELKWQVEGMLPSVSGMFSVVWRMLSLRLETKTPRPHQEVPSPCPSPPILKVQSSNPQPPREQTTPS